MKSDTEVNKQVDEENQTQEALPEDEKGALRATCFAPLLLIDPIATMSTLVVEIFDRYHGDIKFQFEEMIIQMKLIHVYLILGIRVSPIANEFLFVDPEHMKKFRMRRFPKKKNTYGLKEIDDALKQAKLEKHQAPAIGAAPVVGVPTVGTPVVVAPTLRMPAIGSSSSATDIKAIVIRVCSQLEEHGKMLLKLDDHGKMLHNHGKMLDRILMSTVGDSTLPLGDTSLLRQYQFPTPEKTVKHKREGVEEGDEKDNDEKKDVEEKVKSEEEQPQTMVVAEVAKIDIVFFNQEEVVGEAYQASADQITTVSIEKQTLEVEKVEDEASQEEDVGEASQVTYHFFTGNFSFSSIYFLISCITLIMVEGKDDDDGNSQNKPHPEQVIKEMVVDQTNLVLMESEVDITLKKMHALTEEEINEKAFKMACQMN
ncbi:hypothetical protein GIB67_034104 [Kingdonia uniflora]|uniref:Uncharacterized protein n=1 Tax=Kingdonia uniflora TaxID=39325 RepID=A0A7J7M6A8_9MAGN|nr:hypothetical protein GIB67_034104 [Kingdonia uniflora]